MIRIYAEDTNDGWEERETYLLDSTTVIDVIYGNYPHGTSPEVTIHIERVVSGDDDKWEYCYSLDKPMSKDVVCTIENRFVTFPVESWEQVKNNLDSYIVRAALDDAGD